MLQLLLTCILAVGAQCSCVQQRDPATDQIIKFRNYAAGRTRILTTEAGAPVLKKDTISTFNTELFSNEYFADSITHFVRERIPERVVHAHGSGAFGYFEVTHNISHICKADLFSKIGKRTPVIGRFSLSFGNLGVRDTNRELRGFAVKFRTREGNLDLLGLNTPITSTRDPLHFADVAHSVKRNPSTNMPDSNALWDILTLLPEVVFLILYIFSDYGMPASYRHMPSFPVHTFDVYNKEGVKSYVRFHFVPDAGVKNLNATEIRQAPSGDPDFYARDLYNAIENGLYPSWTVNVQILSEEDKKNAPFDIYNVVRLLSTDKYPLHPVGKIVLNRNPKNNFADIEQLAFTPGNLVPGIVGSAGKTFEARRLVYRDAQNYRLGANFKRIPVNCPLVAFTYNRDGAAPVNDNGMDSPNYYPNRFNGPIPYEEKNRPSLSKIVELPESNFDQASNFYENVLTSDEQSRLIDTIVESMSPCDKSVKKRAVKMLKTINFKLGSRVAEALASNCA